MGVIDPRIGKVYLSLDGGDTFSIVDPRTNNVTETKGYVGIAISGDGSTIYVSANLDPPRTAYQYVSRDNGTTWTKSASSSWHTSCVAMSSDGSVLLACLTDDTGSCYLSTNGGSSFSQVANKVGGGYQLSCAMSSNGSFFFVGDLDQQKGYMSYDQGATWVASTNSPGFGGWVNNAAMSADGRLIIAGSTWNGLVYSDDYGVTFRNYLVSKNYNSMAITPDGSRIVVGVSGGPVLSGTCH